MSDITLTWGARYDDFIMEAWPLIRAHWNEVGTHRNVLKLDPDHERYRKLEDAGILHILIARVDGKLAGYFFMLVTPHPRDRKATVGSDDIMYAVPAFRRHLIGPKMLGAVVDKMHELGVNVVMLREKAYRHGGGYLQRYGLKPVETVYSMVIREPHAISKDVAA